MKRTETIELEYQNYITNPPVSTNQLWNQACSNDVTTVNHWRDHWIRNIQSNFKTHGPFSDRSIGELFGKYQGKSCVLAGSGPSLGYNGHLLKDRGDIPLISCLHNFHFFEDRGIPVDFYVSLDAGDITAEEVSEGGEKSDEEYWEMTKDRTLLAWIGASPLLLKKWKGKILFFNCPVPDQEVIDAQEKLEVFNIFVSNGGNVLGGCFYIAKAILGCVTTAFVGADFCFSYQNKFHAWKSKYDAKMGHVIRMVDVFGNKVHTWQSYANFKSWFEHMALTIPGIYINCTEGGTFGAYPEGNIMAVQQMPLYSFLNMHNRNISEILPQCKDPKIKEKKILF